MKTLVFLVLVDICRCILPPLVLNNGGYVLPASNTLNNAGYLVKIVPTAPVSYANPFTFYQNPYTPNSYVTPQASYDKNLYDDYAKRERLKLFYDSLASKLINPKLGNIFNSNTKANNFVINTVPTRRVLTSQSDVSKDSVSIIDDRRSSLADNKVVEPVTPIAAKSLEATDGDSRKYLKKITYIVKEVPQSYNAVAYSNSNSHILGQPLFQTLDTNYQNSGQNYLSQNVLGSGYGLPSRQMQLGPFGYSWYYQPYTGVWNPTTNIGTSFSNTVNREYENVNVQSESKEIINYIVSLMLADKVINPDIIKALSDAQNINFLKLDELDETRLIKMSKQDIKQLKRYLILTINAYGLTPYTFKLLEYIHLVEGKPKSDLYLLSNILADDRAIQYYNEDELNQLKRHLVQIYDDYHESPYVLEFLKYIMESQFIPIQNNNILHFDFGIKNDEEGEDFRKVYLYLSQAYNDNLNVLKILKNINDMYENIGGNFVVPAIDLKDLQSLTNVSRDDLFLLVKFIMRVVSHRGDNSYFNTILSYISQLQHLDKDTNISIISNDASKNKEEAIDLSLIFKYLSELNSTKSNKDVLIILKSLLKTLNLDSTAPVFNNTKEIINSDDLIKIKEFLLRNLRPELKPLILDVIEKINQATKKTEVKVIIQPVVLETDHDTVDISPEDLELIYQYMLKKQTAVPNHYLNKMLRLIKKAQNQIKGKDTDGVITLKYYDLIQIYKYLLQTQEDDINNPVFIKVQQYVGGNGSTVNVQDSKHKPNDNANVTSNIHEEKQINLETVYKFLLLKSVEDHPEPLLLEILDYLKQTLILPNGQLKLKIITVNEQKPVDGLNREVLAKILLYLEKLKENSALYNEFLQYLMNEESIFKDYKEKPHSLSVVSNDALSRIKKYLRALIDEYGENPHIQQIIIEINEILKSQKNEEDLQTISNLDSSIKEDDLNILLQYLSKAINVPNSNDNVTKLLKYIYKSQQNIRKQSENKKNQKTLKLYLLHLVNNHKIAPAIKDILKILLVDKMFENPNSLILQLKNSNKLKELNIDELSQLIEYLLQIKNKVGTDSVIQLLDSVIKQKAEVENNTTNITIPSDLYTNENYKEIEKDVKISSDDIKVLNKYLIDLLDQYGKDENILHILYTINHIEDDSGKNIDLTKLINTSNRNITAVNIDDLKVISKNLLELIEHHGINQQIIKVLRDIGNFNTETEKVINVSIVHANATHIAAAIEQTDLNRIKSYLDIMINNYEPSPLILNILQIIHPKNIILDEKQINSGTAQNIYTFSRLKHEEISQLNEFLLKLMEKYGMRPELLDILIFVNEMFMTSNAEVKVQDNIKQQNMIVVSNEMNGLLQRGVLNNIQNMKPGSLYNLYTQLLQHVFVSPNSWEDVKLTNLAEKLLYMYNNEVTPVNKYILLKMYDYLTKNKESNYEMLLQPEFFLVLLDLKKNEANMTRPNNVNEKDGSYIVHEPYDYKNDVESALSKLVEDMFKPQDETSKDSILRSKDILANYTNYEINGYQINEDMQPKPEEVSCVDANKKFTVVIKILEDLFNLDQQKIDVNMQEFLKIYHLLDMFRKRLSLEKSGEIVTTSVMIGELERYILNGNKGRCHYHPDANVKTLMKRLVDILREVIQYLKVNGSDHNTIKATVISLVETVLPDISAIAVKDCEARTDKELMSMLFSNIYSRESIEGNKLQFSTGYTMEGNSAEDFLHTPSMQQLLEDISKYKNL